MYAKKHASGDTSLMIDHLPEYGINVNYASRSCSHPNFIMDSWIDELNLYDSGKSDEENLDIMREFLIRIEISKSIVNLPTYF